MSDLKRLGMELRRHRRALRLRVPELASRIDVSPTYIGLIENARARTNGLPSRPSADILTRWARALGLSAGESQLLRELAGYREESVWRPQTPSDSNVRAVREAPGPSSSPARGTSSGAGNPGPDVLHQRLADALQQADQAGKGQEAGDLIDAFLLWLPTYLAGR